MQEGKDAVLPDRYPPPFHRRFYKALKEAKEVPESEWPRRPHRRRNERNPEAEKRFETIKEKRDSIASKLNIDPSLLGSRAVLEQIAIDSSRAAELLLNWQRELLGV